MERTYSYKLGVGLIPTPAHQYNIYHLVQQLQNTIPLSFATLPAASTPHLTLFQGKYHSQNDVISAVQQLSTIIPTTLTSLNLGIWAEKIIFLNFKNTPILQQFHEELFQILFPLCEGKSADPQHFQGISPAEQNSFMETGYPFSLHAYSPHVTLAHLSTATNTIRLPILPPELQQVQFEKLVVYRVEELGACKHYIWESKIV
jgi:2'-5' RNA ligase